MTAFNIASGRAKRKDPPVVSTDTMELILPNGFSFPIGKTRSLTAGQISSPSAEILADITATYIGPAPNYQRYVSNGVTLSAGSGGLTDITSAALAALTAGTASITTLYRVTDGAYRNTVYIYDTTADAFHPIGIPPSAFGL